MRHPSVLLLSLVLWAWCISAAPALELSLAYEDQPTDPWTFPNGTGLDHLLVKRAAERAGITLKETVKPWTQCLAQVGSGEVDGALNASFKKERQAIAVYPTTADGLPDEGRRLHYDSYHVYRLKSDRLDLSGGAFTNRTGSIAIQAGFSVGDRLRELQVPIDESAKDLEGVLRKVVDGQAQGAALLTLAADAWLVRHPDLAARIAKIPGALVANKAYYLILSKPFVAAHPRESQALWDAIREVRDSADYDQMVDAYLMGQ